MQDVDRAYYERRAEEELDCAERAVSSGAVKAHYTLLSLYLNRLYPAGEEAGEQPKGSAG